MKLGSYVARGKDGSDENVAHIDRDDTLARKDAAGAKDSYD
jgi:hypothetical protein